MHDRRDMACMVYSLQKRTVQDVTDHVDVASDSSPNTACQSNNGALTISNGTDAMQRALNACASTTWIAATWIAGGGCKPVINGGHPHSFPTQFTSQLRWNTWQVQSI